VFYGPGVIRQNRMGDYIFVVPEKRIEDRVEVDIVDHRTRLEKL